MPTINVQMLTGRSPAQKQTLIRELGEVSTRVLDVPVEAVRIILTEVEPEHWGVGGKSMAELRAAVPKP